MLPYAFAKTRRGFSETCISNGNYSLGIILIVCGENIFGLNHGSLFINIVYLLSVTPLMATE
jgi:hypothetical protein